MNEISTACQDLQAGDSVVKRLSQGHNRIARVDFQPRPFWSKGLTLRSKVRPRFKHSITLFMICLTSG